MCTFIQTKVYRFLLHTLQLVYCFIFEMQMFLLQMCSMNYILLLQMCSINYTFATSGGSHIVGEGYPLLFYLSGPLLPPCFATARQHHQGFGLAEGDNIQLLLFFYLLCVIVYCSMCSNNY